MVIDYHPGIGTRQAGQTEGFGSVLVIIGLSRCSFTRIAGMADSGDHPDICLFQAEGGVSIIIPDLPVKRILFLLFCLSDNGSVFTRYQPVQINGNRNPV